jgi:hypothetical protein
VTVEALRRHVDAALFILALQGEPYGAIEPPAAITGLPVVRVGREIDPQILRSRKLGFLRGHVPLTGILSAIAIMAAVLTDRDAVAMSNEWSASVPTLVHGDRPINHQYSKSMAFETAFRDVLARVSGNLPIGGGLPDYFSALRHRTELWIAKQFTQLDQYHRTFQSCNGVFHISKSRRLDHWCGRCGKCCFTDLILAPFMARAELDAIFDGREPLADPSLAETFRTLLNVSPGNRPFECVGEVGECRAATLLAAARYQSMAGRWARYTAAVGVRVRLGDLRRFHAAELIAGGVPEWVVRERLGQPRGPLPVPRQASADEEIRRWRARSLHASQPAASETRSSRSIAD